MGTVCAITGLGTLDSYCYTSYSSLTTDHCFNNCYVGQQPVDEIYYYTAKKFFVI